MDRNKSTFRKVPHEKELAAQRARMFDELDEEQFENVSNAAYNAGTMLPTPTNRAFANDEDDGRGRILKAVHSPKFDVLAAVASRKRLIEDGEKGAIVFSASEEFVRLVTEQNDHESHTKDIVGASQSSLNSNKSGIVYAKPEEEPIVDSMAATLKLLAQNGTPSTDILVGRANDRKQEAGGLERRDAMGRPITAKQAFRELSYAFHNKRPSNNKKQKREKQYEIEKRKQTSNDSAVARMQSLHDAQAKAGVPYIALRYDATKTNT